MMAAAKRWLASKSLLQLPREDVQNPGVLSQERQNTDALCSANALFGRIARLAMGPATFLTGGACVQYEVKVSSITFTTYHSQVIENCTGYRYEEMVLVLASFRNILQQREQRQSRLLRHNATTTVSQ